MATSSPYPTHRNLNWKQFKALGPHPTLTRKGKSTAQMVLVSPTALIIRYRGIASVDAGTRMAPKIIEKIRLRPRKTYLASAHPAMAAKKVPPTLPTPA